MAKNTKKNIDAWKPKDAKLAQASDAMDRLGFNRRWGGSTWQNEHAGPAEMAAIAALGLPDSIARKAVLSSIAATTKLDAWPLRAIAIETNKPEILNDVEAVLPFDPREWRLCAAAAQAARPQSLAWLMERGCALSDDQGVGALSLMTWRRLTQNSDQVLKGHEEVLALLASPAAIANMSSEAKIKALDAMGKNLIETLNPPYANESRISMGKGSMEAFCNLWNAMEPSERAQARRGVDALFLAKLDLDGRFGAGTDAQACLVPKNKNREPESDHQKKIDKAWKEIIPLTRELRTMSLAVDWAAMEDLLQKDGHSLAATVMRWAANAPDRHERDLPRYRDEGDHMPSFLLDRAFDRVDEAIGKPFNISDKLFIDEEGSGARQGPHGLGRWMMSQWPGSALCHRLDSRDDFDPITLKKDILARMDAYAKDAKAWADGKEIPSEKDRLDERAGSVKSLKRYVLPGFESELAKWFRFAPNDDFATQINRLANDWGTTEINTVKATDFRDTMASWADKLSLVHITLDSSAKNPKDAPAKKPRRV